MSSCVISPLKSTQLTVLLVQAPVPNAKGQSSKISQDSSFEKLCYQ